jgi:hypothetical protein
MTGTHMPDEQGLKIGQPNIVRPAVPLIFAT